MGNNITNNNDIDDKELFDDTPEYDEYEDGPIGAAIGCAFLFVVAMLIFFGFVIGFIYSSNPA